MKALEEDIEDVITQIFGIHSVHVVPNSISYFLHCSYLSKK